MKTLIIFRLYDLSYSRNGEYGNKESLRVSLGDDNVLRYSLFGGWQDSGIGFAISNLQLQKSLPLSPKGYPTVKGLEYEVTSILRTGVGSHTVYKAEILNDIKDKPKTKSISLKVYKELQRQAKEIIADMSDAEKGEGHGMLRVLNLME